MDELKVIPEFEVDCLQVPDTVGTTVLLFSVETAFQLGPRGPRAPQIMAGSSISARPARCLYSFCAELSVGSATHMVTVWCLHMIVVRHDCYAGYATYSELDCGMPLCPGPQIRVSCLKPRLCGTADCFSCLLVAPRFRLEKTPISVGQLPILAAQDISKLNYWRGQSPIWFGKSS